MAFGVRFTVLGVKTLELAEDRKTILLKVAITDGSELTLDLPTESAGEIIDALRLAREAKPRQERLLTRVFNRWEVGPHGEGVVIAFDRGTDEQTAFLSASKPAREIGKALITAARKAEQQKSRTRR